MSGPQELGKTPRAKVSVVTITYNQLSYVAQAVESVISQERDFDIEYIIADDASQDGTQNQLKDLQSEHPEIRLILREENVGSQQNLADALEQCSGQYVAILDGDDYWISPHKLQRQVDFMDAHPDCALVFAAAKILTADGELRDVVRKQPMRARYEIEDLLQENFISSCTVMYRWGLTKLPDWWSETWISDFTLHVLHAQYGWISYIDEPFAAYRVHDDGLWSGQEPAVRSAEFRKTLAQLDRAMGFKYHKAVEQGMYKFRAVEFGQACERIQGLGSGGERKVARKRAWWLVRNFRYRGDFPAYQVLIFVIQGTCPILIKPLVRFKRTMRRLAGRPTPPEIKQCPYDVDEGKE